MLETQLSQRSGSSGLWWRIFNDEALDELDGRLEISNENVKAAAAAFEEARALVQPTRGGLSGRPSPPLRAASAP